MAKNFSKKNVRKYNTFRILAATIFITFVAVGSLYSVQQYNNPNLSGKWQSSETGQIVEFTSEGKVLIKDIGYTPEYEIIGSDKMYYTIDDKDFMMQYNLEGRTLKWGLEGQELEEFTRK